MNPRWEYTCNLSLSGGISYKDSIVTIGIYSAAKETEKNLEMDTFLGQIFVTGDMLLSKVNFFWFTYEISMS